MEGAVGGGGEGVRNPPSSISHMTGEKVSCPTMGVEPSVSRHRGNIA